MKIGKDNRAKKERRWGGQAMEKVWMSVCNILCNSLFVRLGDVCADAVFKQS